MLARSIGDNVGQLLAELPQSPSGDGIGCARSHAIPFPAVVTRKALTAFSTATEESFRRCA
jgi:hypothetical protein